MYKINSQISISSGNIFFTNLQTITITVNCVGVMGKGLALQAKDLFPEIEKYYKNICESKEMKLGNIFIFDKKLDTLMDSNEDFKKILLFPTKDHWRNESKIIDIEKGLQQLLEKFRELKIESLAISALGCGYGGLSWEEVGPLMYKYLNKMNIPIQIFLPKNIPEKFKTKEFLEKESSKITDY